MYKRQLQEGEVRPVGGEKVKKVDVRVLAATNQDLEAAVRDGRFREDLYFRLAVIPIRLPALRERPEDVLPLARHFLERWCAELGKEVHGWSNEVGAWLEGHAWPGNVRELENVIERAVVLARGAELELDDLLVSPTDTAPADGPALPSAEGKTLHAFLDEVAAARIREVLAETGGKRAEAADRLGIERTTLYRLMKKLGVS